MFYKDSVRPDELYHWKYKRRYRNGDHWVYVYDDNSMSESGKISESFSQTNNGQTINKTNTYTTNKNKWLTTTHTTETDTTSKVKKDGKVSKDNTKNIEKTVEYGRLHMMKKKAQSTVRSDPSDRVRFGNYYAKKGMKVFHKLAKKAWNTDVVVTPKKTKKGTKYSVSFEQSRR